MCVCQKDAYSRWNIVQSQVSVVIEFLAAAAAAEAEAADAAAKNTSLKL